jgi:hypothetical protein
MASWYILWSFDIFFVLVCCTKENLARGLGRQNLTVGIDSWSDVSDFLESLVFDLVKAEDASLAAHEVVLLNENHFFKHNFSFANKSQSYAF